MLPARLALDLLEQLLLVIISAQAPTNAQGPERLPVTLCHEK